MDSESTDLIESGSNPDPDPTLWFLPLTNPPPPYTHKYRQASICHTEKEMLRERVDVLITIRQACFYQGFRSIFIYTDPVLIWTKIYSWKKFNFFGSKTTIYLSLAFIKDFQVTKEAFSSQKRTSSTSKHEISKFFSTFVDSKSIDLIESGSNPDPIRIRNYRFYP